MRGAFQHYVEVDLTESHPSAAFALVKLGNLSDARALYIPVSVARNEGPEVSCYVITREMKLALVPHPGAENQRAVNGSPSLDVVIDWTITPVLKLPGKVVHVTIGSNYGVGVAVGFVGIFSAENVNHRMKFNK